MGLRNRIKLRQQDMNLVGQQNLEKLSIRGKRWIRQDPAASALAQSSLCAESISKKPTAVRWVKAFSAQSTSPILGSVFWVEGSFGTKRSPGSAPGAAGAGG